MSIATDYADRAAALTYPSGRGPEVTEARREYQAAQGQIREDFAEALAEEYLVGIEAGALAEIAARTFTFAWEQGHASGYSDVEAHYSEVADLVIAAYQAGRQA